MTAVRDNRHARRIWNRRVRRRRETHRQFLTRRQCLRWNRNEFLRRYFALREAVNGDSVPGISRPRARRIGQRTDRSVQMLSVGAEREPNEIALMGVLGKPCVGEIRDLIGAEIEDRNGLVPQSFLRPMAIIEERGVMSVGAEHHRHWKTVGAANVSGRWDCELLAGRQVDGRTLLLCEGQ